MSFNPFTIYMIVIVLGLAAVVLIFLQQIYSSQDAEEK